NMQVRVGIGFDVHRFKEPENKENNVIPLGGIMIPHNKSIEAHSDGDVIIHAVVDALLGAINAGDIGIHFPPSDPKWRGVASSIFLEYTKGLLTEAGAIINNIDVIII